MSDTKVIISGRSSGRSASIARQLILAEALGYRVEYHENYVLVFDPEEEETNE